MSQIKEKSSEKDRENFETVVIGGGQAGLSVSYHLARLNRDHVVLEQARQAANAWRNHRWDSFTLNTPNWQSALQGGGIPGANRNGFLHRDEVVAYFERYIAEHGLPVRYGVRVLAVEKDGEGYVVETSAGTMMARNVVVATGLYQRPRFPRLRGELSPEIQQIHSDAYRNPGSLRYGSVLVVGSAQSGAQIAEELYESGRKVYLSLSRSGRVPRRYRGKDANMWNELLGVYEKTVDQLPSPKAKFGGKPHISGSRGGHTLDLHRFAADGVRLVGRVLDTNGTTVKFARDMHENLAKADQFEADFVKRVDQYIEHRALKVPEEMLPRLTAGFEQDEVEELDLKREGITSVLWATGYSFDFSMVKLPIFDEDGYPVQRRGVTKYAGLYFVGLPWLHSAKSGLLHGVSEDAAYIVWRLLCQEEKLFAEEDELSLTGR
jgi:putative flavoprotein involved in K+ transport